MLRLLAIKRGRSIAGKVRADTGGTCPFFYENKYGVRDSNPSKSSVLYKTGAKMGNSPVDRNKDYMREMWGTNRLVSDYGSMERINVYEEKKEFLQEIMDYEKTHDLKKQSQLHEKIRNDEDYDDWEYGTEPNYGNPWA